MDEAPPKPSLVHATLVDRYFSDSHCHINSAVRMVDSPQPAKCLNTLEKNKHSEKPIVVVCGTSEEDWHTIDLLLQSNDASSEFTVVGGFGIHPWWAHTATEESFEALRQLLLRHPTAIVAEIGIDTIRTMPKGLDGEGPGKCCEGLDGTTSEVQVEVESADAAQVQQEVYERQMAIAAELARPVSLHMVGKGAYGRATSIMERAAAYNKEVIAQFAAGEPQPFVPLPPAIIFHGFTGSLEFVKHTMATCALSSRELKALPDSVASTYPIPDLYFGFGANTSLTAKSTRALADSLFRSGVPDHQCEGDGPPAHSLMKIPDYNSLKTLPPTCVLIETDSYYDVLKCGTAGEARLSISASERQKVSEVAEFLAHSASLETVMQCCSGNLRMALRSVLRK